MNDALCITLFFLFNEENCCVASETWPLWLVLGIFMIARRSLVFPIWKVEEGLLQPKMGLNWKVLLWTLVALPWIVRNLRVLQACQKIVNQISINVVSEHIYFKRNVLWSGVDWYLISVLDSRLVLKNERYISLKWAGKGPRRVDLQRSWTLSFGVSFLKFFVGCHNGMMNVQLWCLELLLLKNVIVDIYRMWSADSGFYSKGVQKMVLLKNFFADHLSL